jgi:hypothetical protein
MKTRVLLQVALDQAKARVLSRVQNISEDIRNDYWLDLGRAVAEKDLIEVQQFTGYVAGNLKSEQGFYTQLMNAKSINQVIDLCMSEEYEGYFVGEYMDVVSCMCDVDISWDEDVQVVEKDS